jgi:hypothetical protein
LAGLPKYGGRRLTLQEQQLTLAVQQGSVSACPDVYFWPAGQLSPEQPDSNDSAIIALFARELHLHV